MIFTIDRLLASARFAPFAIAFSLITHCTALGATPFAGEDFDGGTTNGGFTSASPGAYTPDNSATNGNFPTSGFDMFGIINTTDSFIPFFLKDDSLTLPDDDAGILRSTDTDNLFAVTDPDNNDNPGGAFSAVWSFDISGWSNIDLSIDMAMIGDFESSDNYDFTYSIDGGSAQTAFAITADDDSPKVSYSLTLESGAVVPGTANNFFDEGFWTSLVFGGPFTVDEGLPTEQMIDFDPRDDGATNGDTTANDGYIVLDIGGSPTDVRSFQDANMNGTFNTPEYNPLVDPLFINGDRNTGTQLTNVLTPYSVPIVGTGSTLTLTFSGAANGGDEYLVFDDILLSGDEGGALDGDFNGDLSVDAADYAYLRNQLGDEVITLTEFESQYLVWRANYGVGVSSGLVGAVTAPEPTSLASLLAATLVMVGARCSRR